MSDTDDTSTDTDTAEEVELTLTRAEILEHAKEIADEYEADGMDLTLRQLYYQFVARGLLPSGQKVYKRIGDVITDARYSGEFPLEQLVDRGRDVSDGEYTRYDVDEDSAMEQVAPLIRSIPNMLLDVDRWYGMDTFVSVWVEKQALEGVFSPVCEELGVSWFACKGYPSVSSLWQWLKRANYVCSEQETKYLRWPGGAETTENHEGCAKKCVVLYFGDHDPDGWEIPRSAERNIRRLMELNGYDLDLTFVRIGLNMEQIKQYNPPPFEAKLTSARYSGYVREHNTQSAWELDALDPRVLRDLIRVNVEKYFDQAQHRGNTRDVDYARSQVRERMSSPEFMQSVFGDEE